MSKNPKTSLSKSPEHCAMVELKLSKAMLMQPSACVATWARQIREDIYLVRRAHARILARWRRACEEDVDQYMHRQVQTLGFIAEEALAEWMRSKKPENISVEEEIEFENNSGEGNSCTKKRTQRKDRTANPAYLMAAIAALKDQRDLMIPHKKNVEQNFVIQLPDGWVQGAGDVVHSIPDPEQKEPAVHTEYKDMDKDDSGAVNED